MRDKLTPCPVCGKFPNIWHHRSEFGISNVCDVYCKGVDHIVTVTGYTREEAIIKWNTRGDVQ